MTKDDLPTIMADETQIDKPPWIIYGIIKIISLIERR